MSERKAFGTATPVVQRVGRVLFVAIALALPAYIAGIAWELNSGRTDAGAVHIDFVAFWAAAKLAVAGEAVEWKDRLKAWIERSGVVMLLPLNRNWEPYCVCLTVSRRCRVPSAESR